MGVLKDGTVWHLCPYTGEMEVYGADGDWHLAIGTDESMTLAQLSAHQGIEKAAKEWGREHGDAWVDCLDSDDLFWENGFERGNALFYTDQDKECARDALFTLPEEEDEDFFVWLGLALSEEGWLGTIITDAAEDAVWKRYENA